MIFATILSAQKALIKDVVQNDEPTEILNFKLYPNPVLENRVYITTKNNAIKDIVIYNIFGEVVLKQRLITKELNITKLVSGIYLIQVTENKKSITRKLVVK